MEKEFKPTSTDEIMGDKYEHPTFGYIHISKPQGQARPLFGSSVEHTNTITLTVSHAHLWRNLSEDRIFSDDIIVEVEMSSTQFADLILGQTPVTLHYLPGKGFLGEPPIQNRVTQFNKEFELKANDLSKSLDAVLQLAKDTKAQKRLIKELELAIQEIRNNMPFMNEQFSEQMDNTINEAKGAVESFVNNLVQQHGIKSIRDKAPRLIEGKDKI